MKKLLQPIFYGLLLSLLCACSALKKEADPEPFQGNSNHPFLIVKKDQFAPLRAKSTTEPWKSMKADALARSAAGINWGSSNTQNAYNLQYYVGAAALAYILDESNAPVHASRVRDAILNDYSRLDLNETSDWGGVVPNMGSFFVAILSLDIVHDALSETDLQACESAISDQIFKLNRTGSWADVRRGTHGTWDIYQGVRTTPDEDYYQGVMAQITEDGVSPVTIHYAWERVGGGDSRISKSGYMDVLEFTGIDRRYYENERLKKFQRWLFGSSINTAKEMAIIGDMLPTQGLNHDMLHLRVVNFDSEAAAYAAWFHEGVADKGNILTYILPKEALPAPQVPSSQLYTNGGAFFREKADDPNGLHAVLYNIMSQDEWHTHQEVNGLALSGYGNRLLVNSGRLGAPVRAASLNNTLTQEGSDHASRLGSGIKEGFTAEELDYAAGASGPAWPGRQHDRNLLLIHATDGGEAYVVLLDEAKTAAGAVLKNYLHPANETQLSVLTPDQEYVAPINHKATVPGAQLAIFLATPPIAVQVEKVPSAVPERYPGYPDHNRLEASYAADAVGNARLATVLFPFNASHAKATFSRIPGSALSGGSITQTGGLTDYVWVADGAQRVDHQGTTAEAQSVYFRELNGPLVSYFVRKGTHFQRGGIGFDADVPLSLYARGNTGVVISPGATLTLRGPGVSAIVFEPSATVVNAGADSIQVLLPAGRYDFR